MRLDSCEAGGNIPEQCDLLIINAFVITMDEQRRLIPNGAIAIKDGRILAVGRTKEVAGKYTGKTIDAKGGVVHPGLVDCHEHLCFHITRGWEPDTFSVHDTWTKFESKAFPALTAEDQILSTILAQVEMAKNGITAFCDTGTAFYPDEVMPYRNEVGIRGYMGSHIGDTFVPELKFLDKDTDKALSYIEHQLAKYGDGRVKAGVGMSGMGNCSDRLVAEAKKLAAAHGRVLHMHQCVYEAEIEKYREKYHQTPIEHLDHLGVLDAGMALVHMIHVSDTDIALLRSTDTRVVHCPGASLKFSLGAMSRGKFPQMHEAGISIALGTDAGNWADGLDILQQVYLAATVHREVHQRPISIRGESAFEMATLGGARAIGLENVIGALKPGMSADLVLHKTNMPECRPAFDPFTNLIYAARSKSVDTVLVQGEIIVEAGRLTRFDEDTLYEKAERAAFRLADRIGYPLQCGWPVVVSSAL